jgi:hypothetical protein
MTPLFSTIWALPTPKDFCPVCAWTMLPLLTTFSAVLIPMAPSRMIVPELVTSWPPVIAVLAGDMNGRPTTVMLPAFSNVDLSSSATPMLE